VLSGHIHVPWARSHTWPEGFTTRFVSTGSSGKPSGWVIEQFDLPLSPAEGLGYHEHLVTGDGLVSRYHRHTTAPGEGRWTLEQAWTTSCRDRQAPSDRHGLRWHDAGYHPEARAWTQAAATSKRAVGDLGGEAFYLRQTFEAEDESVALYLELLTEREAEIYLNGELVYRLDALGERPQAWKSAGGTYTIDSPVLHLGLSQRLVRKGENVLALQVRGEPGRGDRIGEYVAFRQLARDREPGSASKGQEVGQT
jgi:hypothetical protein